MLCQVSFRDSFNGPKWVVELPNKRGTAFFYKEDVAYQVCTLLNMALGAYTE